jgi:MFS family permease
MPVPVQAMQEKERFRYLTIIGILFAVFGFMTWLGSVLIPFVKIICELNNFQAYLIAFCFYISYMVFALPSGALLNKLGYRNGMTLGLLLMVCGVLLFIPGASSRSYPVFLTGQFLQGCGLAILQTAANPYVVALGPQNEAARRISLMGICNGIAGIIAPIILGSLILNDTDKLKSDLSHLTGDLRSEYLTSLSHKLTIPYVSFAIVLFIMALLLYFSGLPEVSPEEEAEVGSMNMAHQPKSIFGFPHLLFGVFTLFLYVGVEVIAGDSIILYGSSQGIALSTAKFFTSFTLSCMLIGYLISILVIPRFISQEKALLVAACAGIVLSILALSTHGLFSIACIAMLGLANAPMYPSIWPLSLNGLGMFTKSGASLLIMAIGGGAFLPLLYGRLADRFSPHYAYFLVLPCYAVILLFAYRSLKISSRKG